jgi:hypothetical protein
MLRAPIWMTSATSTIASSSLVSMSSVTIGRPGLLARLGEDPQARAAEPWNEYGDGARLVGAAAEHRRAGRGHDPRRLERLVARLDRARPGDEREVLAADLPAADLEDRGRPAAQLGRRQLVGLEDRHDLVDAGCGVEAEALDVLAVADGADHGHLLASREVRLRADALDASDLKGAGSK